MTIVLVTHYCTSGTLPLHYLYEMRNVFKLKYTVLPHETYQLLLHFLEFQQSRVVSACTADQPVEQIKY